MPEVSLPAVPYDRTADRPRWTDLPATLRCAIAERLGAPVTRATTAGAGFTRGFAAVLECADGQRAFVKAASLSDQGHLCQWYAREAAITAALPPQVPTARPRWTLTAAGHFVLCLDAIDGRLPTLPWRPAELTAALTAWATAAAALRRPPAALVALGLPRLPDLLRSDLCWWTDIAAGRQWLPPVPGYARARLAELADLEAALPRYAETAEVGHGDLRLDNVLIDSSGAAWFCDWTWACHGPAWFDTASLLVTARASGLDADARYHRHPTSAGAPADALDATLAALSGYWLTRAAAAATDASGAARVHQRFSGRTALDWLAERRGWV